MISEETIHSVLTAAEIITVSAILLQLTRTYRGVRSRFNLGLVLFSIAMMIHVVLAYSTSLVLHVMSEAFELTAFLLFLRAISR